MRLLPIISLLLFFNSLSAQQVRGKLEKSNEKLKNSAQTINLQQTITSNNGKAIAVGSIETQSAKGLDAYALLFNPLGQETLSRNFGGMGDDAFHAVVQLPNGNFMAAGYTHDASKQRKAWLVELSADLEKIVTQKLFDMDAFYALVVDDEGAVYAFSSREKDPSVELACLKIKDWKIEFDKKYPFGNAVKNIKSAAKAADGGVVVVGDTRKSRLKGTFDDDIWIVKLDKKGENKFFYAYGEKDFVETAEQIIPTSDNGFAIAGSTNNTKSENYNAWLLKLDETGNKTWANDFGGKSADFGQSVAQTPDNRFYLVGKNMSYKPGMRHSDIYFVKVNPSGDMIWEDYDGEKQDDQAKKVIPLFDGSYLLTAQTESASWLYRFRFYDDEVSVGAAQNSNLRRSDWRMLTDDGFLDQNLNTALSVRFTNMGLPIKNLQIRCKSNNPAIQPQTLTYLGTFQSNESKVVAIPVKTGVGLDDNSYNLEFEIVGTNDKFTQKVTTKRQISGRIAFSTPPQYQRQNDGSQLVTLTIENRTNQAAQGLSFRVEPPSGLKIMAINETALKLPLEVGKKALVTFQYQGDVLRELGGKVPQFNCIVMKNNNSIDAIKVAAEESGKTTTASAVELNWESPNQDEVDIQNLVVRKPNFDIKLKAFNVKETVREEQFKLIVNEIATGDSKMKVVDLSESTQLQQRPIFRSTLTLDPLKIYRIRVDLQLANGSIVSSRTVSVRYNPEPPNLHVLSIGAAHKDLKFTGKDAQNMADFFENENKSLPFKNVWVDRYTDSAKTDYRNFKRSFRDLAKRYDENAERRIEDKDYLVVFISSHGKTDEDRNYQLLPSDYKSSDDEAIDYQRDIMSQLNKIKCHKIILIDACHSGALKGVKSNTTADALMAISKAAIGTTTIVSCDANELSYEDERWQNGAFTKALLEAFKSESCSDESGLYHSDVDGNKQVTLDEIVRFIKRRVPRLVGAEKRQTGQNPVVINDELDREIPLSIVKQ